MSAPRTKRQFAGAASDPAQRQITSFFTSATAAATTSSPNGTYINQTSASPFPSASSSSPTPHLPASVQSNLLSVGMRIRKSVPEGYKTGNYDAFALWDESDTSPTTAVTIMGEGQRSRANAFSTPRELLPFCGIHKVGGLDTQPGDNRPIPSTFGLHTGTSTTPAYQPSFGFGLGLGGADMDDMPGLTSSQDSVGSNASTISLSPGVPGSGTRKRFFVEDEEDEIPRQLNLWRYNHDISLSPLQNNGRAMAVPRKRRLRAKFSGTTAAMSGAGQENLMVVDSDFEEAEFLDQGTWDMDMSDA
ncbi:ribonucleotide reductase inhibitor-domain-containing protein [Xylaria cf. heliscus]|nr:ribonucleotide reductase inhibitor-domain-containing protein [Xylaria cf. heliscus]